MVYDYIGSWDINGLDNNSVYSIGIDLRKHYVQKRVLWLIKFSVLSCRVVFSLNFFF